MAGAAGEVAAAAEAESRPQGEDAQASPSANQAEDATPSAEDIFLLARQQNFQVALKLLEAYPQHWTALDDDGHSLLHWGALVGNLDFVKCALSKGIAVDLQASNKQTPLMWSTLRGHVAVSRALLDAKADLAIKDSLGATALTIAVQHQCYKSILLLLNRSKQRDAMLGDGDKNGCTVAHWAAYKGDLTSLKLLDYFGADLQALDSAKMLPIHRATCASQFSVIEFLVEKRSDFNQRNGEQKSCLDIASDQQDVHMQNLFKKLMKKAESTSKGKTVTDVEQGGDTSDGKEGEKKTSLMQTIMKDKAAHKIFPVFWLVCVSMAMFEYLMDLRMTSYQVAPTAAFLFELGVPMSVALFAFVVFKDPGKIPARTKGHSGVEELMKALDGGSEDSSALDISRLCTTTWVLKDLRTKYCTQTGACVEEFDHYCVWLNTSIGKGNHREFVGLAIVEWCTQVFHIYLCWCMTLSLVPYQSFGNWAIGVMTGYPLLALIWIIQIITAPWVFMLVLHQGRLIAMNLTTNEMMNMHRYEHFWSAVQLAPGRTQKMFRNPFNKGNYLKNCLDFWWLKGRSDRGPASATSGCKGCASGHCHR